MLSIAYINQDQLKNYFTRDNYYEVMRGEIRGELLKDFGGNIDLTYENWNQLVMGYNPNTGEKFTRSKANQKNKRGGIDHTFSAPKSYSVLLGLSDATSNLTLSNLLRDLHDQAVNQTMNMIEAKYSKTRVTKNKKQRIETTGKLVYGKFEHMTSRAADNSNILDYQLHTHVPILNYTLCRDGKYRSLEIKDTLKNQVAIGGYYRSILSHSLKKHGIDIEITNQKKGLFEIKGIKKELIYEFSKRRELIEVYADEIRKKFPKMSEPEVMQKATLQSRRSKNPKIKMEDVHVRNLQRANQHVNVDQLLQSFTSKIENTKEQSQFSNIDLIQVDDIDKRIEKAIKTVSQKAEYFHKSEEYLKEVEFETMGDIPAPIILNRINRKEMIDNTDTGSMLKIVKRELKSTRLDTQKLFSSFERLKNVNIDKHILEEKIENGRSVTNRVIARYAGDSKIQPRSIESTGRDFTEFSRDIDSKYRGRIRRGGDELERYDVDTNRIAREHTQRDIESEREFSKQLKDQSRVTEEDLKNLTQKSRALAQQKQNSNEKGL